MNFTVQPDVIISDVRVNIPAPINYPATGSPYGATGMSDMRSFITADINGDGYLDIFFHPSHFSYGPALSPIVLLNNGKGGFFDGSAQVFKTPPLLQQTNNVFFEDFNEDGRLDLFVVDQGLELHGKDGNSWDGSTNKLFLQGSDGFLNDVSATIPHNAPNFNHVSTLADVNGDGRADVVLTTLGGSSFEGQGTAFYFGNGAGGFDYSVAGLPEEIRYLPVTGRQWDSRTIDYQFSGANAVGDLDNDGRADLVTASYLGPDTVSGKRTIRTFAQGDNGDFVQKWSAAQPQAMVDSLGALGVADLEIADLDGDGLKDIVAMWENGGMNSVQILRNLGNLQFEDTSLAWLGSYLPRVFRQENDGAYEANIAGLEITDVNHDGKADIVFKQFGISPAQLASGRDTGAFIYLNDGTGHFSAAKLTAAGQALSAEQLASMTGNPPSGLGKPLVFDANNDGMNDLVFIEPFHNLDQSVFPYKMTTLHVATMLGKETGGVYQAGELGDHLIGSSGADFFYGGKGSDHFQGAAGVDTLVLAGASTDFKIAASAGGGFTVQSGGQFVDTLAGIERIQFGNAKFALYDDKLTAYKISKNADGTVSVAAQGTGALDMAGNVDRLLFADAAVRFDIDGNGGQAYRVYQAAFARTPDLPGLGYWLGMMDKGVQLGSVAAGFVDSAEFRNVYGAAPSNREIVERFYQNVLQRPGEKAGIDYWTGVLDKQHATIAEVLVGFSESPENQAALVGVMANGVAYTPYG